MLLRKRPKPLPLRKLEVLIPRTPSYFSCLPDMQQDLAKRMTGYIGEKRVDYHLRSLAKKYTILHDVHLKLPYGNSIQIDSLILTPYAIFIIEIKNYKGTITFDTLLKQLIRNDGEKETGFKYPITQAENHQLHLENWLHDHHFANVPIRYFLAIADPGTIIKVEGDKQGIAKVVTHAEHLPQRILEIDAAYAQSNSANLPVKKISDAILSECEEFDIDILGKYGMTKERILPGVGCPECGVLAMERQYANWKCRRCGKLSKDAHTRALDVYFLLISDKVTNRECMWFLKINSRHLASRILKSYNLTYFQKGKYWTKKR